MSRLALKRRLVVRHTL